MGTYYTEFTTTVQGLPYDLGNAILGSTDWARISPTSVLLNTSAASVVGATSLTFTSTTSSGLAVGDMIAIEAPGNAAREYRKITAITSTTITFSGTSLAYAHTSGTAVYRGNEIFKATTTRGAAMIVDLVDDEPATSYYRPAFWRAHTGTVGTDKSPRYLPWRVSSTGSAWTNTLHVTVSAGKEHLFISIEGPRAGETGAVSAGYGSGRMYLLMCDLVPYHASDTTPAVFAGAAAVAASSSSFAQASHLGVLTRNLANTVSWDQARLGSVCFPYLSEGQAASSTPTGNLQRQSAGDGKWYLFPYVVASDADGVRGRLSSFFFAGLNGTLGDSGLLPPVGSTVTYAGATYKILLANKGDSNNNYWGVLGAAMNGNTANASVVVAVPYA